MVLLAGLALGIILTWVKLYVGWGLIASSCTGYLGVYYVATDLAAILNRYAADAGLEQVDVSSSHWLMYAAWGGLGISLIVLLFQGSYKE